MILLAVDTSTPSGSVAVLDGRNILVEHFEHRRISHSDRLMPAIHSALKETGMTINEVEGFAVSLGPGSFTALRVGLATIKGLALGAGRPVCGINTLEAIAWPLRFSKLSICPLIDARKKQVFAALFRPDGRGVLAREARDASLTPRALAHSLAEPVLFAGNGLFLYGEFLEKEAPPGSLFADASLWYSRASVIGLLAQPRLASGKHDSLAELKAHYVRRSEAEIARTGET